MDMSQRTVKRQGSFCNAITFSNRPIAVYEQVRLKITKKQCCWSGALRLGFTSKDPSRINPDTLPKYACPDLVSQSGFWAKALPEELSNEGNIISFWVDKRGRVFYRINDSSPMLFFSGIHVGEPLWALIDVYGLTRGVQLLDSEMVPLDCQRSRSFAAAHRASIQRNSHDPRLSISLCDLSLQQQDMHLEEDDEEEEQLQPLTSCHVPQNSQNSQQCSLLPGHLDTDLHFHTVHGVHVTVLDKHTVARLDHRGDERTLVFTSRPMHCSETVLVKVKAGNARAGSLSYGVTSCDPATLRPSDLPSNPESLVDRKEFWAVCRVGVPLHGGDILGFVVTADGEVIMSHNGISAGMQLCVDNSRPLWMFYGLHGTITQLRILGSSLNKDLRGLSVPSSPSCTPNTPTMLCSGNSESNLNTPLNINLNSSFNSNYHSLFSSSTGTTPSSPFSSHPESPTFPSSWSDECTICYENVVDTVLYACGHMCLCYACGLKLKKMTNACCPICRRIIKDIIKTYRST